MPPTWNDGMLESWNNGPKRLTSVFGSRLLGSIFTFFNPWFVYPMSRIIFQPDGTPMVPIFHHSIIPLFQL
jgi:hypothetical protein